MRPTRSAPVPSSRFVVHEGVRLHVRVHGEPVRALLLPGITTSAVEWDDWIVSFDPHVAVIDQRGRGDSDSPPGAYTITTLAEDDAAVIRALGGRLDVIGHSQGAYATLRVAILYPELVRRVVAIEPPLVWGTPPWSIDDEWAKARLRAFAADDAEREAIVREIQPQLTPEQRQRRARMLGRIRGDVFRRSLEVDPEFDLFRDAPRIAAPVLLVAGTEARGGIPAPGARRLAAALPRGRLATLDTGHDVALDDASGLARLVRQFLDAP